MDFFIQGNSVIKHIQGKTYEDVLEQIHLFEKISGVRKEECDFFVAGEMEYFVWREVSAWMDQLPSEHDLI